MELIDEKFVSRRGEEIYLECVKRFGEERVLGVFSIGLYNYNSAETMDEVKYMAIYIPTFEDLCTQLNDMEIKEDYILRDVRAIYFYCQKVNGSELELLYSLYQKINPIYKDTFKEYFLKYKEEMGRKAHFFQTDAVITKAKSYIEKGDLFGAARLRIATEYFLNGSSMEECFRPTQSYIKSYLENVKHGVLKIEPKEVISEIEELIDSQENIELSSFTDKKVKLGVINIINIGLKKKVDLEEFECELTATEKKAFSVVKENLNENKETCLSVSKICKVTGISRPIWKNLFAKMENQQIAEISNMGVKGTFIKFL